MPVALTNQEAFNIMVRHLRRQQHKCFGDDGECAYRGNDGDMCAVGVIIPNKMYDKSFEGSRILDILTHDFCDDDDDYMYYKLSIKAKIKIKQLKKFLSDVDTNMLIDIQLIHDCERVSSWDRYFEKVAVKYGLQLP